MPPISLSKSPRQSLSTGSMKRATLYEKAGEDVICLVCERACKIRPRADGICRNYRNINEELYHIGYGVLEVSERIGGAGYLC